jgi:tetratricopeptide (TPR) repeat protein
MSKVALLIGVGEYLSSSGLQNLAAAARDVAAMRDVLVQPEIGGFAEADVTVLLNPGPQGMREALERLFAGRQADDLVVLYFSGHGVVDDYGKFHLTTARTDKGLLNSTAIPAGFVHGLMEGQGSKRQVVILDCCFSGAFAKDMKAKGEAVNLQPQLGGKGRAVLTSSSATEYSFEQKEAELSVYTQYVVEGLRTGIADGDGDGWISVDELHEFAQGKVREVAPAMQPKIYAVEEGYKIRLAQAPMGDPRLEYRKEVEKIAEQKQGKFSATILMALETKQQQLGLHASVATAIRQEVLRPYEEFAAKCKKYQQAVQQELQQGNRLSQEAWEDLQYLQQTLGMKDENIQPFIQNIRILPVVAEQPQVVKKVSEPVLSKSPPRQSVERDFKVGSAKQTTPELEHNAAKPVEVKVSPTRATVLERTPSRTSTATQNNSWEKWLIISIGVYSAMVFGVIIRAILPNLQAQPIPLPSQTTVPSPSQKIDTAKNMDKTAEEFFKSGLEKSDKKDYKGAITDYDQAIKLKPDYAVTYNNRGWARYNLGDHPGADADYDQAIKINQNWGDSGLWAAHNNRGLVHYALGDRKAAIMDYDQAIKLKPDDATAYYNRGNAHYALGDRKAAIVDYDQAIKLKPDDATAYNNRAYTHWILGDKQSAIVDYDQAIKLKPDYAEAYSNRGVARRNLGDNQGAIADYDEAIKLNPDDAEAYTNRGNVRLALGDNQVAIANYRVAVNLYKKQGKTKNYEDVLNQIKKLQ